MMILHNSPLFPKKYYVNLLFNRCNSPCTAVVVQKPVHSVQNYWKIGVSELHKTDATSNKTLHIFTKSLKIEVPIMRSIYA